MSDEAVQQLIQEVRGHMSVLFKICESVAMLDMVCVPTKTLRPLMHL